LIRFEGVSKSFDDKVAVDSIDLAIEEGRLFGLIGPNGAGKTTTLKMLATLIKPDQGSIHIGGLDALQDVRAVRRSIGYMPDSFGTFRGLTCEEYLLFFGRAYGLHGQTLADRAANVLALTDLDAVREELTAGLSTGMRQRLSLAKTLIHDPKLLVLDEPASGLDPRARIEIREFLKELAKMGKTIIISSHILADLEEICSDVAIIEQGRVVWQGPLDSAARVAEEGAEEQAVVLVEVEMDRVSRAVEVLGALPFVVDGGALEVTLREPRANEVLGALVSEAIDVVHFSKRRRDLEKLFLTRTKGLGEA
jgi:ABC-2 type transport system ATP-binding protein